MSMNIGGCHKLPINGIYTIFRPLEVCFASKGAATKCFRGMLFQMKKHLREQNVVRKRFASCRRETCFEARGGADEAG